MATEAETQEPISKNPYDEAATAMYSSGISHETAKDEALHTVAAETLDSSKGEILVEAPMDIQFSFKETVEQLVKIVSEELENEEYLASNGNNVESKDEKASEAKEPVERDTCNVNVMTIDKERTTDESTSDRLHKENKDSNKVGSQVTNFDILEGSEDQAEGKEEKTEGGIDIEDLERESEDNHIKIEAETGIFNDESNNNIDSMLDAKASEKENTKESLETMTKEGLEPAEGDKLESPLDAVSEEPEEEKLERDEDKHVKIEDETGIFNDERTNDIESIPVAEPSEKGNTQNPLEKTAEEDLEPIKDETKQGKLESSLYAVPEGPEEKKLEQVNEDKDVKIEAETGICDDERTDNADSISVAEPSDKGNRQEPLKIAAKVVLEPEKDEPEHGKLESSLDVVPAELEKKLERVNEDKDVKTEAETGICHDERTDGADSISVAESSDNENRHEPLEMMAKEDLEPAEDVLEHGKLESPLDEVPEEQEASMVPHNGSESYGLNREHEKETTSKEELVMNVEECSPEDKNKYEPIGKAAIELLREFQDTMTESRTETVTANEIVTANKINEKNEDDKVGGLPVAQEIILDTKGGGEMHETATSEEMIRAADDNVEHIAQEAKPENIDKISETVFEDQNHNKVVDAETTDFISDDGASLEEEIGTLCTSKALIEENIENAINAEEGKEQSSEEVEDNESHERYTQQTLELATEKDVHESIEDNSTSKVEQTNEETEGMSLQMEQMVNEKPGEWSELIQERDSHEVAVDSVISSEEYSTERGPNHDIKKDSWEDKLNVDNTLICEKIVTTEHNAFTEVVEEKNHVEKQENFNKMDEVMLVLEGTTASADNPSYQPDDRDDKVKDGDNQNDEVDEKHEEALNSACKDQVHETTKGKDNIKVSNFNDKTSPEHKLVSELVSELKSQETRTDTESTQTEKSNLDDNSSNENMKISILIGHTEAPNEESEDINRNDVFKETVHEEGDKHEATTNSTCEELDQNGKYMNTSIDEFRNDIESANEDEESSTEHGVVNGTTHEGSEIHEDATNFISKELSQSIDKDKNLIKQETELDSERATQPMPQEHCHDTFADIEVMAADIDNLREVNSTYEAIDGLSTSLTSEEYNTGVATDPKETKEQISTATNENEGYDRIMIGHTELIVETDIYQKTEEKRSIEGEAIPGMRSHEDQKVTEKLDNNYEVDQAKESSVEEEENAADYTLESVLQKEKWEDKLEDPSKVVSRNTIMAEQSTYAQDVEKKDPSEKHEEFLDNKGEVGIILDQVAYVKDTEDVSSKPDGANIEMSEMVKPNDDKENAKYEANLNKDSDEHPNSHVSVEETTHGEVGQKNREGSISVIEEQIHQAIDTNDKTEVDVCEEEKEIQKIKIIPESLPEDKCQKETGETDAVKIDNTTNDEDPKIMIPGLADLNEDAETAKEKDEANLNTNKGDFSNGHTSIVTILPDQTGEHEDASKTECEEQIDQVINDEGDIEVDIHKEKADSEELENITESVTKEHNEGSVSEQTSTDNSAYADNLDKVIPEIFGHNDDHVTVKVKDEDVLEKDTDYASDTHEVVAEAAYDGVGEKHEDDHQITNTEDNKEAAVQEKKGNLDINLELGLEVQMQDTICETESTNVEKALNLEKDAKISTVRAENACDATSGSNLKEIVIGNSYELESNDKKESREKAVLKKEETVDNILEKGLSTVNTNSTEVISENQIEGKDDTNINPNSEIIDCEEKQKFEEAIPEVADRDQNKERYDGDNSTESGTTIEEVKVSDTTGVVQNFQPSSEIETVEVKISEDASPVMKVDASAYQDYEESRECKENTNISHMVEKSVRNKNEEKTNEIVDDIAVTSTLYDEAACENLQRDQGEKATEEDYKTGDGIPNEEIKESEDGELKDKGAIIITEDNLPVIPTSNEETRQLENAHEKSGDSSHAEQIHDSISLNKGVNLDTLIKENLTEHLETDYASMVNEQDHKELSGKEPYGNDKRTDEDRTGDGEAFRSSFLAKEVEAGKLHNADEFICEENLEAFELEKNKGEKLPKKEEVLDACLGVSSNIGFSKPIVAEVEHLSQQVTEKEKATIGADEEAKDAKCVSQMDIETMGDTLYANEDSLDKNMQDASVVVPEEKIHITPEDNSIEVRDISENENIEEQDVHTNLQEKEVAEKPQEKEFEMHTKQKSYESRDPSEANANASFKEKETTENDSKKEKTEVLEMEEPPSVVPEAIETTTRTEDIHESETKKQSTENNNEENFLKDGDMKLVESAIELEPPNQSNKSIRTTDVAYPSEEALNMKGLVDDVAKVDAHNEGNHCKMASDLFVTHELVEESTDMEGEGPHLQKESMELETDKKAEPCDTIVTQNEEIAERSETLNTKLQKDIKDEVPSNIMLGSQEITNEIENTEKKSEDVVGSSYEQIQEYEAQAQKNNETNTDTVRNDEVKEYNHQSSTQSIIMVDSSEILETSSTVASVAEETKQEISEFSKISDYWPRGYNEAASNVSATDTKHPKEMSSYAEQPSEIEKFTFTSADSTAACKIDVKGEDVYVTKASASDAICQEGGEKLKDVSDLLPKEVDEKIGSSIELTEDNKNPHEQSATQEPQVNQPEEVMETEQLTDKAIHGVEFDNLQEEKQQVGLGELPVSQFLMKYILQEDDDTLNGTCDEEYEGVTSKQNEEDKQKDIKIPTQEETFAPLSAVQLTEETSIPEDKVNPKKYQGSSESAQAEESYDVKENSEIRVVKDDASLQNTLDKSTSRLAITEDGKDQVDTLSSEISNHIVTDDSMELTSAEQSIPGITVDSECYKEHDLLQDEKIKVTVLEETLTEKEIQKENETQDKDVDVSMFGKASEDDIIQKEVGEERKECLQDVGKVEPSCVESDRRSEMDEDKHAEILDIKSEVKKIECGEEKQDVENQVQILKNDSGELQLFESQKDHQSDLTGSNIDALKTAEKFLKDKNSEVSLDKMQMMETTNDMVDEDKYVKEEDEEHKPEKSGCDATTVETRDTDVKSIQKCDQTRKSSESSTFEDHKLRETSELQSEFKKVESGEKKQDVIDQNQVQIRRGSSEEMKLSESQKVQKSDLPIESTIQPQQMTEKLLEERSSVVNVDENHTVQTTDESKTDDQKDEKQEEDEHNPEESGHNATINVETRDVKPTSKKSHGILSGVGSKVKHSIAKVKKAITGKSSHSKTLLEK